MSKVAIASALYTQLATGTASVPISYANEELDPPGTLAESFIVASVAFAQPENNEVGRGRDREVGYLEAVCKFPLGEGEGPCLARCEAIAAVFPKATSLTATGGISVITDRPPEIRPAYRDGDRWAQAIRIRFFANL